MGSGATITTLVVVAVGYLVGSVPLANLVARRSSIDLREVGDRNPGYWNAREVLGRRAAIPVFLGDLAKGVAGAGLGAALADPGQWWLAYVGAGSAMVGHAFPLFARFSGGRSILSFVGGALVFAPVPALFAVILLLAVFVVARSFAVAARVGFFAFPVIQILVEGPYRTAATGALMSFIGLRFAMARDVDDQSSEVAPPRGGTA